MSSSPPTPSSRSSSSSSLLGGGMSSAGSSSSKKFRHAILKNLLLGLSKGGRAPASSSRGMSLSERRDAVRHAANAALTAARGTAPLWSQALAAELSSKPQHGDHRRTTTTSLDDDGEDDDAHHLVEPSSGQCKSAAAVAPPCKTNLMVSRRRRLQVRRARPKSRAAGAVASWVMARRRRARALREMVPGGRGMADECTLLGETLDYAVSLKAQVEAMQLLLRTLQQQVPAKNKNPLLR